MHTKSKKLILPFSVIFYLCGIVLMIIGTKYDLNLDKNLFAPESGFAVNMELFGQVVYWAMWGPLFCVLFLTVHTLSDSVEILKRILPFIPSVKDTEAKAYIVMDRIYRGFFYALFFVLADVGWKKLVENVMKRFVDISQVFYFIICAAVSVACILLLSKLNRKTLNTLEGLALAGVLLGIGYKLTENAKEITHRIRFREMVAASNGIYGEDGLSFGKLDGRASRLNRGMIRFTDFSAFTPWNKKGNDMGIYSHADSFPSGHTVYSCTLYLSCLFCAAFDKLKKVAPVCFILTFIYVALMGYSRLIAGAHYLTDVVAGAMIGYTLFLIVGGIYLLFNKKGILPTREL